MKRSRLLPLLIVLAFILGLAGHANAEVLFSEDFESYANGSDIVGQGGWTGETVYVTEGNYLTGSQVLNGRYVDYNAQHFIRNDLSSSLNSNMTTILSFDAYATSDYEASHNDLLGFSSNGANRPYWAPYSNTGGLRWMFWTAPGVYEYIQGGFDQAVALDIVVDGAANEIYGIYDFNGGGETIHYSVTDEYIAGINEVVVSIDTRFGGSEFDNITVAVVPEPISSILFITGGSALGFRRFRKRAIVQ